MRLSIIFPAFNEEKRLPACFEGILNFKSQEEYDCEVILVDDGSTDKTLQLAKQAKEQGILQKVIALSKNQGKGAAVKAGMLAATGEYLLFSDVDLSTPLNDVKKLLAHAGKGRIVIGSRAVKGANITHAQPFYRVLLGKLGNVAIRMLAVPKIKDTQCGFKLYPLDAAKKIFSKVSLKGFAFDFEALFIARRLGYRVIEVPITWKDVPGSTVTLKKTLRTFLDLLSLRFNYEK